MFIEASLGKRDLLDLIVAKNYLWRWNKDPEELLKQWFETENCPDTTLLKIIADARSKGSKVYLATQQEKHRANYIREVMYPGLFDGDFMTCDVGLDKADPAFFEAVLNRLQLHMPGLAYRDILYFDDRQNLIDTATRLGIQGYLYKNPEQVKRTLDV